MIDLSDNQLEIIMRVAAPLSEGKCQEFLERVAEAVAVVLQMRGQINDDDVSAAVQLALRDLIHDSAVWKEWRRNSLSSLEGGQESDSRPSDPPVALRTWRTWRLPPAWYMNLWSKLSARRQPARFGPIVHT